MGRGHALALIVALAAGCGGSQTVAFDPVHLEPSPPPSPAFLPGSVDAGRPKVVSERLGHTKVAFTLDRYGHVLPGMQEKASAKLEAILFGR